MECEISREKVPLRNAYKHVGQRASVRVNSGVTYEVCPAAPPFPQVSLGLPAASSELGSAGSKPAVAPGQGGRHGGVE